jgi:ABC-2 type transport system permease protein
MRAFAHLYRASFIEWSRDQTALLWTLVFPVMLVLISGLVFRDPGPVSFSIGLVNEAAQAGQPVIAALEAVSAFEIHQESRTAALDALDDGERQAVIVIPAGVDTALSASSDPATLPVYYDPAASDSALVLSLVREALGTLDRSLAGAGSRFELQTEAASTRDLRTIDVLLPGVLAVSLMQLGLFVTAAPLVGLRERQVLRRMGTTPLGRFTLLASQVAFRLTIALGQVIVVVILGRLVYGVRIDVARLPAVAGCVLLGAAVFITLGYVLAGLAKTEEAVQGLIAVPNILFMMLAGVFFEVESMPGWIRPVVDAIPLTYLADGLRQTMVDAAPLYALTTDMLVLAGWLLACAVLSVRFFKWEAQG